MLHARMPNLNKLFLVQLFSIPFYFSVISNFTLAFRNAKLVVAAQPAVANTSQIAPTVQNESIPRIS